MLLGTVLKKATSFTYADSLNTLNSYKCIVGKSQYLGREGIEFFHKSFFIKISRKKVIKYYLQIIREQNLNIKYHFRAYY